MYEFLEETWEDGLVRMNNFGESDELCLTLVSSYN